MSTIIKVYLISMFQHGSSNSVQYSSQTSVFLCYRKPSLTGKNIYQAPTQPSELSHLLTSESLLQLVFPFAESCP